MNGVIYIYIYNMNIFEYILYIYTNIRRYIYIESLEFLDNVWDYGWKSR